MISNRLSVISLVLAVIVAQSALAGDVTQMRSLNAKDWTVPDIELKMKLIPAGSFTMGSPQDEKCRRVDEVQHQVEISNPFYMGVYEVTQREFYRLMMPPDYDYEIWKFKRGPIHDGAAFCYRYPMGGGLINGGRALGGDRTDLNPMECVTWGRAREFCAKLTEIESKAGRLPDGYVYRLPTEAEWEYACRAGTESPYNVECDFSDLGSIHKFAWVTHYSDTSFGTHPVGEHRKSNEWGLFDMHGNVYEWCLDWYAPYPAGKAKDPTGPAEGTEKVIRGGCFAGVHKGDKKRHSPEDLSQQVHPFLRSASRYSVPPEMNCYAILGFRVVMGVAR